MRNLVFILCGLFISSAQATEVISHMGVRAALAMADLSKCDFELVEPEVRYGNGEPTVVYTYILRHNGKRDEISFEQDRQVFLYTTDNFTYERIENYNGTNIYPRPKDFILVLDSNGVLNFLKIGQVTCY